MINGQFLLLLPNSLLFLFFLLLGQREMIRIYNQGRGKRAIAYVKSSLSWLLATTEKHDFNLMSLPHFYLI